MNKVPSHNVGPVECMPLDIYIQIYLETEELLHVYRLSRFIKDDFWLGVIHNTILKKLQMNKVPPQYLALYIFMQVAIYI